ncbi:MAG: hypothetical protein IPL65_13790 [Lewinellaceae bacterium]|nr:hypothetical protein [Lewinellaceae bacterium]
MGLLSEYRYAQLGNQQIIVCVHATADNQSKYQLILNGVEEHVLMHGLGKFELRSNDGNVVVAIRQTLLKTHYQLIVNGQEHTLAPAKKSEIDQMLAKGEDAFTLSGEAPGSRLLEAAEKLQISWTQIVIGIVLVAIGAWLNLQGEHRARSLGLFAQMGLMAAGYFFIARNAVPITHFLTGAFRTKMILGVSLALMIGTSMLVERYKFGAFDTTVLYAQLSEKGIAVPALVTEVAYHDAMRIKGHTAKAFWEHVYVFQCNEKTVSGSFNAPEKCLNPGDSITIRYLPDHPDINQYK